MPTSDGTSTLPTVTREDAVNICSIGHLIASMIQYNAEANAVAGIIARHLYAGDETTARSLAIEHHRLATSLGVLADEHSIRNTINRSISAMEAELAKGTRP